MASVLTPYGIDGASTGRQPARLGCGATLRASSSAPRQSTRSGRTRLPWDPARARRPPGPSAERARSLFEQAVGAQAERVRNREAKRLCGLEVDDQLEARRPFDRQIGRLGALEDSVDEERCPPVEIALPRAVGHEAASLSETADSEHRGQSIPQRHLGDQLALLEQKHVIQYEQGRGA